MPACDDVTAGYVASLGHRVGRRRDQFGDSFAMFVRCPYDPSGQVGIYA